MSNHEIAAVFEEIADLLEFQGANPFRTRAYRNAARTIRDLPESIADIAADPERSLTEIEGLGADLAQKAALLAETGSLPMLDELRAEVPESVLAILRVPGLGPKRGPTASGIAHLDPRRTPRGVPVAPNPGTERFRGKNGSDHSARIGHRCRGRTTHVVDRRGTTRPRNPDAHAAVPSDPTDRRRRKLSTRP